MKCSVTNGQRGAALVIMLAVLIVVSIGILAMTNGIGNMQRSAVNFGRADQSYNAASTGLNAARAYLKSLAFETKISSKTFGGELTSAGGTALGRYDVTITLDTDPAKTWEHEEEKQIGDVDGIPVMGWFKDYQYTYDVRSVGSSAAGQGKRILEQEIVLRRLVRPERITVNYTDTQYNMLANGNLKLSGNANFGNVHTNSNFEGSGNARVDQGSAVGTVRKKGNFSGAVTPDAQPISIPQPDWDMLAAGGPDGSTYVLKPGEDLNKLDPSVYAGKTNIYVNGDLALHGNLNIDANIFVTGRVSVSGNVNIVGVIYARNDSRSEEAISLSGNAYVDGGLIADGAITASGNFHGRLADFVEEISQVMTQEVTVNTQDQSVEEESIIDVPDQD